MTLVSDVRTTCIRLKVTVTRGHEARSRDSTSAVLVCAFKSGNLRECWSVLMCFDFKIYGNEDSSFSTENTAVASSTASADKTWKEKLNQHACFCFKFRMKEGHYFFDSALLACLTSNITSPLGSSNLGIAKAVLPEDAHVLFDVT